jgi:hypothetical protein
MTDPTPGEVLEASGQGKFRQAKLWHWIVLAAAVAGGAGAAGCWLGHRHIHLSVEYIRSRLGPLITACGLLGALVGGIVGTVVGPTRRSVAGSALRAAVTVTIGFAGGAMFGAGGGALTPLLIVALGPTLPPEAGAGLAWALGGALSGWAAWEWKRVRARERSAEMAAVSRGSEPE